MLPLHKGVVLHHLEYGWDPWNARASRAQLQAVEKVQMRALDIVDRMDGKTYVEQLIALNLTTLSYRRCQEMILEMWKHFNVYESDVIAPFYEEGL